MKGEPYQAGLDCPARKTPSGKLVIASGVKQCYALPLRWCGEATSAVAGIEGSKQGRRINGSSCLLQQQLHDKARWGRGIELLRND